MFSPHPVSAWQLQTLLGKAWKDIMKTVCVVVTDLNHEPNHIWKQCEFWEASLHRPVLGAEGIDISYLPSPKTMDTGHGSPARNGIIEDYELTLCSEE